MSMPLRLQCHAPTISRDDIASGWPTIAPRNPDTRDAATVRQQALQFMSILPGSMNPPPPPLPRGPPFTSPAAPEPVSPPPTTDAVAAWRRYQHHSLSCSTGTTGCGRPAVQLLLFGGVVFKQPAKWNKVNKKLLITEDEREKKRIKYLTSNQTTPPPTPSSPDTEAPAPTPRSTGYQEGPNYKVSNVYVCVYLYCNKYCHA